MFTSLHADYKFIHDTMKLPPWLKISMALCLSLEAECGWASGDCKLVNVRDKPVDQSFNVPLHYGHAADPDHRGLSTGG